MGVKYLRSPTGAGEIQLFSNTINAATGFRDPANVFQLFRYLSGNLDPSQGDQACNVAGGFAVGICFINPSAADARFYQSSTALNLTPGGFGSIVVAYIFAAPVAIPGFSPTPATDVTPGNPVRLTNAGLLSVGANQVDSLTGFNGYSDIDGERHGRPERVPHHSGLAAEQGAHGAGHLRQRVPPPVRTDARRTST